MVQPSLHHTVGQLTQKNEAWFSGRKRMIEKAILTVMSILFLLVVGMQLILFSLPLFQRMTFDAICHRAVMQMDHDGGLTNEAAADLRGRLEDHGFTIEVVSGMANVPYGSEASLYVRVRLIVRQISPGLDMEEVTRVFTYTNSTLSRKIFTDAGEPLAW
jgi:hypothetical protein